MTETEAGYEGSLGGSAPVSEISEASCWKPDRSGKLDPQIHANIAIFIRFFGLLDSKIFQ